MSLITNNPNFSNPFFRTPTFEAKEQKTKQIPSGEKHSLFHFNPSKLLKNTIAIGTCAAFIFALYQNSHMFSSSSLNTYFPNVTNLNQSDSFTNSSLSQTLPKKNATFTSLLNIEQNFDPLKNENYSSILNIEQNFDHLKNATFTSLLNIEQNFDHLKNENHSSIKSSNVSFPNASFNIDHLVYSQPFITSSLFQTPSFLSREPYRMIFEETETISLIEQNPLLQKTSLDPVEIFKLKDDTYTFKQLSQVEMKAFFGQGRTLSDEQARKLYNRIAKGIEEFATKRFDSISDVDPDEVTIQSIEEIALEACKTRHHARKYIRERTSQQSQKDAELVDLLKTENKDGFSCKQIIDHYKGDPKKIIDAAARTNSVVNKWVNYLPKTRLLRSLVIRIAIKVGLI